MKITIEKTVGGLSKYVTVEADSDDPVMKRLIEEHCDIEGNKGATRTCKGSVALGTGCMECSKCKAEIEAAMKERG